MASTDRARPARPPRLNKARFATGLQELARCDTDLENILERLGPPPLWSRRPGFPTLVHLILEQQVSIASAKATFDKLKDSTGALTPESFLGLSASRLRKIGFSRQKAGYCRNLAQQIQNGTLQLGPLARVDDEEAARRLIALKGIGRWTADCYLLMALGRPDIWPAGDLALAVAVQRVKGLSVRPSPPELERIAESWRPWRAVAARLFWHYYLAQ